MKRVIQWMKDGFIANVVAWLLLAFLLLAVYDNHQKGELVDQVCDLTGPHDTAYDHPVTDREKLDTICFNREPSPYGDGDDDN